jgi:predicted nucleic acid-binding protein
LTVLAMTGVTALVRATASRMEAKGITYPARDIGDWLRQADVTHISNEVSFADACLIRCAEIHQEPRILTFDSDFSVYRWARNRKFDLL